MSLFLGGNPEKDLLHLASNMTAQIAKHRNCKQTEHYSVEDWVDTPALVQAQEIS